MAVHERDKVRTGFEDVEDWDVQRFIIRECELGSFEVGKEGCEVYGSGESFVSDLVFSWPSFLLELCVDVDLFERHLSAVVRLVQRLS